MTSIQISQTQSGSDRVRHVLAVSVARVAAVWKAATNRRAVVRLHDLDDRMLRDIGLTRHDVHAALAGRRTEDPSPHLQAVSGKRGRTTSFAGGTARSAVMAQLFEQPVQPAATPRGNAVETRYSNLEI